MVYKLREHIAKLWQRICWSCFSFS